MATSSYDGIEFRVMVPDRENTYPGAEWTGNEWHVSGVRALTTNVNMRSLKDRVSRVDIDTVYGTTRIYVHTKGGVGAKELVLAHRRGARVTYTQAYLVRMTNNGRADTPDTHIVTLDFVIESDITP